MLIIDDKILKQSPLAEGGEGIIYEYNNQILKVYKDTVNKLEKLEKIKLLMSKNLPTNVISPVDIAYNSKNQFIGYVMQKVDGEEFKRLTNKKFLQINNIKTKDILKMTLDIKNTLIQLHKQNIFISDLNDCNILFDKNYNIYFIDCDSWTIDNYKCTVCMDSFKDPLMVNNSFSDKTDDYAFAILTFKSLTRLHPFGGTTNPDMDILERMKKGISVIDNKNVIIPKTISKWSYMSPKLLQEMKSIFDSNKRILINTNLDDYYNNLKLCSIDNEYYYAKYNECPMCNDKAIVIEKPIKIDSDNGIPFILFISYDDIKTILSQDTYIDNGNNVIHVSSKNKLKYKNGYKYYFSNDGEIVYAVGNKNIKIKTLSGVYDFEKTNKSNTCVNNDKVYFVNLSNNLVELSITQQGNYIKNIQKVAFNNIFEVIDDKQYFICNIYDNMKIINVAGYNYTLMNNEKINNYGLHFDIVSKRWLFITENHKGNFATYVFDKNKIVFQNDTIRYSTNLSNICFFNNIIFTPNDGLIKGFSFEKNVYKDFICPVVNEDSKLIREGGKFIVINEKEIYKLG